MYKALHQSIRTSEKLAALSDFAFRVWSMGLVAADMAGRITASPRRFHAEAFPLLDYNEPKLAAALAELKASKLAHFYEVDEKPYLVFHDHDEYNKAQKNLRNIRSAVPPPPSVVCYCVTYAKGEDVPVKQSAPPIEANGSARILAALWNDGPGEHLTGKSAENKIQAAIDVGVDPKAIEQAFWDHPTIKGRKIWEVLDPLRPVLSAPGVPSVTQILEKFAKGGK